MKTRREFLLGCSTLAAASLAATPSALMGAVAGPDPMAMAQFRRHLKTIFLVQMDPSTNVELELVQVKLASTRSLGKHPIKAPDRRNERFSLLFRGPLDGALAQDTYSFDHKKMGTFPVFIVPMKKDTQYHYYEAVFNRRNKLAAV